MQPIPPHKAIYTIGHSTHAVDILIQMLQAFDVKVLVDIRSFPGSKRYPQYNKEALRQSLEQAEIQYLHIPDLGGRRQTGPDKAVSKHSAFGGYKEHMKSEIFRSAVTEMQELASGTPLAYMCAEANWRHCHRSLVSDFLRNEGWKVIHITGMDKSEQHVLTAPKRVQGRLFED